MYDTVLCVTGNMYDINMIGIDIVKISRIKCIVLKFEHRFIKKTFHLEEISLSKRFDSNKDMLYKYLAKRFAAKEAYIKAIGYWVKMKEIAILNNKNGKPILYYNNEEVKNSAVSLSDDGDYAIAVVNLLH